MKKLLVCLIVIAACGGGGGTSNDTPGDDTPGTDGSIDTPTPMMITISGTATARGLGGATPVAAATITAHTNADENTAIATAMTDAMGNFSLVITTVGGAPLDGFLKATKAGHKVSYLYPPSPVGADLAMVPMNMLDNNTYGTLHSFTAVTENPANGVVGMIIVSGQAPNSPPVQGAKITTSPASTYRYNNPQNGFPGNATIMMTHTDGIAYAMAAPPGAMTVMATKTGSTFKPTMLKVHADSLTQTLIVTP